VSERLFSELRRLGFEAHYSEHEPHDLGKVFPDDYSTLSEKDFETMLAGVQDLQALEGIANRRRILGLRFLQQYSPAQIDLIKARKWQIENKAGK